jgi:membrane protease YdiL (CAAX protease family)
MLSDKLWKPEAVVRLVLSVLICMFASALVLNAAQHLGGVRLEDSPWHAVVAALSFQGVILVFVHIFVREHQMRWADAFGFHNNWKRAVLIGALVMLLFLPIGWGLQWTTAELMTRLNFEPDEQQAVQALRLTKGWMDGTALAVMAIFLAPLAEEFLFRGILYTVVKQLGFPRLALWGTSLLFAAIHWNLPTFLPLLVLALMLTLLYEKTGNLLAPIVTHSLFNALNFSLFYFGDRFK